MSWLSGVRQHRLLPLLHQHLSRPAVRPAGFGPHLWRTRGRCRLGQPLLQGLQIPSVSWGATRPAALASCAALGQTESCTVPAHLPAASWSNLQPFAPLQFRGIVWKPVAAIWGGKKGPLSWNKSFSHTVVLRKNVIIFTLSRGVFVCYCYGCPAVIARWDSTVMFLFLLTGYFWPWEREKLTNFSSTYHW